MHKKEHGVFALEQGGGELLSDTPLGGKTEFKGMKKDGVRKRKGKVVFWGFKRMAAAGGVITMGGGGLCQRYQDAGTCFCWSLKLSASSVKPPVLQMRGGADTDEEMGHERDASPKTHGPCVMIFNSVHTVRFASISCYPWCLTGAGTVERRRARSFRNKR